MATEGRRYYNTIFVAKKRAGKTTLAKKMAEKNPNPIIVINTDYHPAYKDYESVSLEQLKTWKGKKCVVYCRDEKEACEAAEILNKQQTFVFVIFEDAQKYIAENTQDAFRRLIINHRMRGIDLCFLYHALKFVPVKVANNYDMLFLFKTSDSNKNLEDKYGNWGTICERRERIMRHSSEHYCEVIRDYE